MTLKQKKEASGKEEVGIIESQLLCWMSLLEHKQLNSMQTNIPVCVYLFMFRSDKTTQNRILRHIFDRLFLCSFDAELSEQN